MTALRVERRYVQPVTGAELDWAWAHDATVRNQQSRPEQVEYASPATEKTVASVVRILSNCTAVRAGRLRVVVRNLEKPAGGAS